MPKTSKTSKKKSPVKKKKPAPKKKLKKKGAKKTTSKRKGTTKVKYESVKEIKVDKVLLDNFVALQKVLVNLSSKFDDLSNQISKLLNLFEISAKSLVQKDTQTDKQDKETQKILERLDKVSEHAGLIGKGLALIHDINKEEGKPGLPTIKPQIKPFPPKPRPIPPRRPAQGMQGYQRSISHKVSGENA